jgi:hypothetical protein
MAERDAGEKEKEEEEDRVPRYMISTSSAEDIGTRFFGVTERCERVWTMVTSSWPSLQLMRTSVRSYVSRLESILLSLSKAIERSFAHAQKVAISSNSNDVQHDLSTTRKIRHAPYMTM